MDRNLFLRCQSFLYPLSISSVPDDSSLLSPNDSNLSCCREILLDGMNLSIEPCENTSFHKNINNSKNTNERNAAKSSLEGQTIGPAYFLTQKSMNTNTTTDRKNRHSNEGKKRGISDEDSSEYAKNYGDNKGVGDKHAGHMFTDPTFCKVQLTIRTAKLPLKGLTTPVKKANKRNISEIEDQVVANDEAILIAKIDGNYFQVDLNRIRSISIGKIEDNHPLFHKDNSNEMSNTNSIKISSCLILELPSCCFRIFPSSISTNDHSVIGKCLQETDDDGTKFDAARSRLETLLSADCLLPFPLSYSGLTGPSPHILEPDIIHKSSVEDTNVDPLGCSRRCLQSYSQSWKDLILFDDALENPYSEQSMRFTRETEFKDSINHLMAKIPKQVSLTFIKEDKWTKALELYEDKIQTKIKEFDVVFDDFWNETSEHSRNNKRRRKNEDFDKCHSMIQYDCVGRFAEILKDHKKYVHSKHELYLLPLRG